MRNKSPDMSEGALYFPSDSNCQFKDYKHPARGEFI